jgi:hypothetical protein
VHLDEVSLSSEFSTDEPDKHLIMRSWGNFSVLTVIAFALSSTALAAAPSETAIHNDNITYLAPLLESCAPENRHCNVKEGKYIVSLREGYTPSSHLSYISEKIHIDPVKQWNIGWRGNNVYSINNVSADSLDLIRQDPGVIEVEQAYYIIKVEMDGCRNPSLSEEGRRICYEEEDLPGCERSSLSEEKRKSCYGVMKLMSCIEAKFTKGEMHPCKQVISSDPCDNSELSEDQQRFCRDGSLVATCHHPLPSLFEEGRRTCVMKAGTAKSKTSVHGRPELGSEGSLQLIALRSDDNPAPLEIATSDYGRPDTYIVTLVRNIDYHDHFKTIGRDLEADHSTGFKWFQYANAYYVTNITSDWVCLSHT